MEVVGENTALLSEILSTFVSATPKTFERLKSALENRDPKAIIFESHSLKNSAQSLGLLELHRHCADLELRARSKTQEDLIRFFPAIDHEYKIALHALTLALAQKQAA